MTNLSEVARFVTATVGAIVCIVLSVLAYLEPPVLALGDPLRVILLIAGLGALGVQVSVGYASAKVNDAARAGRLPPS